MNIDIKECVLEWLGSEPSGALMLSGEWGHGKSFFVRNELLPSIRLCPCTPPKEEMSQLHEIIKGFSDDTEEWYGQDVTALNHILTHRYRNDSDGNLWIYEKSFWTAVKTIIETDKDTATPGFVMARQSLLPILRHQLC